MKNLEINSNFSFTVDTILKPSGKPKNWLIVQDGLAFKSIIDGTSGKKFICPIINKATGKQFEINADRVLGYKTACYNKMVK